jgi:putative heme transporter
MPRSEPHRWRRAWPWIQFFVGIALAALALWALAGRRDELAGVTRYLDHTNLLWVAVGACAEAASFVAFALMQQRCLRAGDVSVTRRSMTGLTLAATAMANSIPAGPVVASVYAFRQYRRRGADDTLAGWTLVASLLAASISLALLAAVGVVVAGSAGHGFDLTGVTFAVLGATLFVGVLFVQRDAFVWVLRRIVGASRRLLHVPRGDTGVATDRMIDRLTEVGLSPRGALEVLGWGLANWVADLSCLVCAFLAVGAPVPWRGIVLAYGAGQLAANLPITPGGLGVVEGSITIALSYFGGSEPGVVAAVLLYRILSFWVELPVGWGVWAWSAWSARRASTAAPVVAPAGGTAVAGGEVGA